MAPCRRRPRLLTVTSLFAPECRMGTYVMPRSGCDINNAARSERTARTARASDEDALREAIERVAVARSALSDAVVHFHGAGRHALGDFCNRIMKMVETATTTARQEPGIAEEGPTSTTASKLLKG